MKNLNGKYLPVTKGYLDIQFTDSEIHTEVKTYTVNRVCTKCYDGVMKATAFVLPVSPPKYPHICSNCGHEENLSKVYPRTETRPV